MLFLEADLAIFKRLTGWPLDGGGRPLRGEDGLPVNRSCISPPDSEVGFFPSWGVRIPMEKPGQHVGSYLSSKDPDALRPFELGWEPGGFRQVPVFSENMEGRQWEDVWPSVTFRWAAQDFDPSTFIYSDPFKNDDKTSNPITITDRLGRTVVTGYDRNLMRLHPDPWLVEYHITARAMNPFDIRFLCSAIPRLFPPRGGIVLRQMDGTDRAADFLLKRTENRDRGGDEIARMLGVEEQRCYERVFVYTLEANEDNTLNAFGMNDITTHDAVTERLMELANIQGTVLRNLVDLNKA